MLADNTRVRFVDKISHRRRVPMIASSHRRVRIHALLNDRPLSVVRDYEAMKIKLKPILDCIVVHARGQPAAARERISIQAGAFGVCLQFLGSLTRVATTATADEYSQLARARIQSTFERAYHRSSYARRMPIHAHHGSQCLKPEGVGQPGQQGTSAVVMNDVF